MTDKMFWMLINSGIMFKDKKQRYWFFYKATRNLNMTYKTIRDMYSNVLDEESNRLESKLYVLNTILKDYLSLSKEEKQLFIECLNIGNNYSIFNKSLIDLNMIQLCSKKQVEEIMLKNNFIVGKDKLTKEKYYVHCDQDTLEYVDDKYSLIYDDKTVNIIIERV